MLNQAWAQATTSGTAAPRRSRTQAKGPIQAAAEMNMPLRRGGEAAFRAFRATRTWFGEAFPDKGVTEDTIVKAIATFERTVVAGYAPFDAWIDGDETAISESAKRGFALFNGKAQCAGCHTGWNFTDNKFHDIGTPRHRHRPRQARPSESVRRCTRSRRRACATSRSARRTCTTASGDLEAVMIHYVAGGEDRPSKSPLVKPLALDAQDVQDLAAFMRSLSSPQTRLAMPNLPSN